MMMKLIILATIAASCFLVCCDAHPVQTLPVKPGYIPVFIRYGDEPLENINPDLALAFREFGLEGRNFKDDDDDENMLADAPAAAAAGVDDSKSESSISDSSSSSASAESSDKKSPDIPEPPKDTASGSHESQEAPKALPVQEVTKMA